MEPKKIKKLVLKKETISNLSEVAQNQLKGGAITCDVICAQSKNNAWGGCDFSKYFPTNDSCNCGGGGSYFCGTGPCTSVPCGASAVCSAVESCNDWCHGTIMNC